MSAAVQKLPSGWPREWPVDVIAARLQAQAHGFEKTQQTAFAIIGALEQGGWVIVRKRHQR